MPAQRPFLVALLIVAVLCGGALAPSGADQASPFPVASGSPPAPEPSPQSSPQGTIETNPFPSATPTAPGPERYGYVGAGYVGGNASGGQIPPTPGSTSTPSAFPGSGTGGFWLDLAGRLGTSFFAQILYENANVHGGDFPLISYAQGRVAFEPHSSHIALGLAYASVQRSTSNATYNGVGAGINLLPDFRGVVTPYASIYVYPHVQGSGTSATFTSADAGVLIVPQKRGGLFFSLGGMLRSGLPASTSPSSFTALKAGIGSAF